jgi:hypothetical protein
MDIGQGALFFRCAILFLFAVGHHPERFLSGDDQRSGDHSGMGKF